MVIFYRQKNIRIDNNRHNNLITDKEISDGWI